MSELLLFLGLAVLTAAFLNFRQIWLRRLGVWMVGVTSFAAGYLPTGKIWVGLAVASLWLFVPWIEILLRVRHLRLPLRRKLRQFPPPSREVFPTLEEDSERIEASGFEHVADMGWEMDEYRQFLRLYARPSGREEAVITCVQQSEVGFDFISITSRGNDGTVYTTWNCQLAASLQMPPTLHLQRLGEDVPFEKLFSAHGAFVREHGLTEELLAPVDLDAVRVAVERDMEVQMQHNLSVGVLRPLDESHGVYSWKGMLFLWVRVLREIFRLT